MALISTEDQQYLSERFRQELEHEVKIELFIRSGLETGPENDLPQDEADVAEACQVTQQLFEELTAISPKIVVERFEVNTPEGQAAAVKQGIDPAMLPAFRFHSQGLAGRSAYFGMPVGFEFGSLVETISDFSRGATELGEATKQKIKEINTPLNILLFVTPT